jgi:hypothetical protein
MCNTRTTRIVSADEATQVVSFLGKDEFSLLGASLTFGEGNDSPLNEDDRSLWEHRETLQAEFPDGTKWVLGQEWPIRRSS